MIVPATLIEAEALKFARQWIARLQEDNPNFGELGRPIFDPPLITF